MTVYYLLVYGSTDLSIGYLEDVHAARSSTDGHRQDLWLRWEIRKGGTSGADMRQGCKLVHRRLEDCFSQQIFKYTVATTYKYQNQRFLTVFFFAPQWTWDYLQQRGVVVPEVGHLRAG